MCLKFYKEFNDPETEEKCWKFVDLLFPPLPMDVDSNSTQAVEMRTVIIVSGDEIDEMINQLRSSSRALQNILFVV